MLSRMWIFSKEDFLQVLTRMFHEILSVEGIHFDQNDDISVVFCKKDIKELIAFCNTISIHAGKNVKEFTLETCHDSVYYFRATKENGYWNQIRYNQMMKDMCFSFLDYLEEQPYGKA